MNPLLAEVVLRKVAFLDFNKPVYVPYPVYLPAPGAVLAGKAPGKASAVPAVSAPHRYRRHHKHGADAALAIFL